MFSMEPQRTDYDLNFRILGFPVRVHPLFWLVGLMIGASAAWPGGRARPDAGMILVSWVVVVFVSILVHELGHSLMMRRFGQSSHIVLYMLGGLAIPDGSFTSFSKPVQRTHTSQILISLAGPGAGFLLAAITVGFIFALGGEFWIETRGFPFFGYAFPDGTSFALRTVIGDLLWVNIFWGFVNLLPVFPLDGGQVARALFERADAWNGLVRALWLSIYTAGAVAIASFVYLDSRLMPLMFLSLAASNYMTLQQITGGGGPGGGRW
jgi:Zn-dependent protease